MSEDPYAPKNLADCAAEFRGMMEDAIRRNCFEVAATCKTFLRAVEVAQADTARLDWLKADPYNRLQKVREWLPISTVPPAPDNTRAAFDNAMKHDPNYRP